MAATIAWYVFWISVAALVYTYLGFPLLLAIRALLAPRPVRKGEATPSVSMIIAAYNEIDHIAAKLDNCLALDYPAEKLEVIIASDGSDDGTNDAVASCGDRRVRLLALSRRGKNLSLNAGVESAGGEVLVFSDADTILERDALRHLVAPFSDAAVGGVAGDYRYMAPAGEGAGERAYWSADRLWKRLESRGGSVVSASGQIYALRRELFSPVPQCVTDDFFCSTQAVAAHRRLIFEPLVRGHGPVAQRASVEFGRKVRVISAGLRSVWAMRHLLNPLRYGFYALQLLSHKVFRRLMFVPIVALAAATPFLWNHGWVYRAAGLGQLGLHGAAAAGWLLRRSRVGRLKVLSLPFFFDMVYVAAGIAVVDTLRSKRYDVWEPHRPR